MFFRSRSNIAAQGSILRHHHPSAPQHFTGCVLLCSSSRCTRPAESPCPRPCNRNPRILHRVPRLSITGNNTKAECSHHRALPSHYITAFCNHALVTKERMASPLDLTPELQDFWTAHPRERIFGSRTDAFSVQFTGFAIYHLMYDDKHMPWLVQHAIASALNNQETSFTFVLFPNWMENSNNAFRKMCTDNKIACTILKYSILEYTIIFQRQKCDTCQSSTSKTKHHPCKT